MSEPSVAFDVVILAGGRGTRLGGVSKADLVVGGVRLLDRVLAAASGARTTVVVGRVDVPDGVRLTSEEPPGSGPAAGLVAGLAAVDEPSDWTLILACDLPDAEAAVQALLARAAAGSRTAYAVRSDEGHAEWLLGLYRSAVLREAAAAYGDPRGRSVRGLLGPLDPELVEPGPAGSADLDTWADHATWNRRLRRSAAMQDEDRSAWRPFVERAAAAVDIDPDQVDLDLILTMTREIAHAGARPMAPVSAYLLGLAVGQGGDPEYLRGVLEDAASAAPVPETTDEKKES